MVQPMAFKAWILTKELFAPLLVLLSSKNRKDLTDSTLGFVRRLKTTLITKSGGDTTKSDRTSRYSGRIHRSLENTSSDSPPLVLSVMRQSTLAQHSGRKCALRREQDNRDVDAGALKTALHVGPPEKDAVVAA